MSESFRGELSQKVDSKARVSIPAAFRRVLEAGDPSCSVPPRPRVVMVYGDERRRFVECYSITEMKRVEALIARLPKGSPNRRLLERNLITLSATVEIDEDGRIVLPPRVRDKIGVTPADLAAGFDAIFAGTLETFQIWKRDVYDSEIAVQSLAAVEQLSGGLDMLALLPDPEA
ncbi:MAG: division/cell wall cluster transcriptional repressor MraZ [Cereibacter sp.]|nr:division/cell wall cluster transcriptional repressor MraZ [Rhodobacter sp.]